MRFIKLLSTTISILLVSCLTKKDSINLPHFPSNETVEKKINLVLEWQLQKYPPPQWSTNWLSSTLFIGISEFGKLSEDEKYRNLAQEWGEKNNWEIHRDVFNADNQASAQVYLDIYTETRKHEILNSFQTVVDSMRKENLEGRKLWYWCDALFMSPPAIAKLGKVTGNEQYFKLLNRLFWDTHDYLYDKEFNLFYRDDRFFDATDSSGNKIFWSRGNGWVIAGIARILENLPETNPRYSNYVQLYKKMIHSIVQLQPNDGLWRTNLLNPKEYPRPETSGTAFFCYALGWGLNNNIIIDEHYELAFIKAWNGLISKVNSNGKLGSVQSVAASPGSVDPDNSEIYATGAFLLAAAEMYKWTNSL